MSVRCGNMPPNYVQVHAEPLKNLLRGGRCGHVWDTSDSHGLRAEMLLAKTRVMVATPSPTKSEGDNEAQEI